MQYIKSHLVENIEVDLIDYNGKNIFQTILVYINDQTASLLVKRLDTMDETSGWTDETCGWTDETCGWTDEIKVFIHDHHGNHQTLHVGRSEKSNIKELENIHFDDPNIRFLKSNKIVEQELYPSYKKETKMNRLNLIGDLDFFNMIFKSDIVELPHTMLALGFKKDEAYVYYAESGQHHWKYEIALPMDLIVNVMNKRRRNHPDKIYSTFYCVLYASDGFFEGVYSTPKKRDKPIRIGYAECRDHVHLNLNSYSDNEYPVFHKLQYILAQSVKENIPYVLPIIDRYYLQMNYYNCYRSFHKGIVFDTKIPKIVYAGRERGGKHNYLQRKDIELNQRDYFRLHYGHLPYVFAPKYIKKEDMVNYKYVLDIDGNACTWDATAWKLNSGSVLFKTESCWRQWFYDDFIAWKHYVPIKEDFSDIKEKFDYCEAHPDECLQMIKNAKALFQKVYFYPNIEKHIDSIIDIVQSDYEKNIGN